MSGCIGAVYEIGKLRKPEKVTQICNKDSETGERLAGKAKNGSVTYRSYRAVT